MRRAVAQAEAQAGTTVEEVIVTGQFQGLAAQIFEARLGTGQSAPTKEDAHAISAAAEEHCLSAQRKLLHLYTAVDETGNPDAGDGSGALAGEIDVVAISMPLKGARQIAACLAKSLLTVRSYVAGPVATALSVTTPLEREAGVLVADMGAQSTGYALFFRSIPVAVECIVAGGQQITEDIARTFVLREFEAGRRKVR
ncbi:MAG: hypothetical protein HY765_07795 [Rhodomicrobium sp.]|nr:hypothetical protein [Rhodomicrobium sp.]